MVKRETERYCGASDSSYHGRSGTDEKSPCPYVASESFKMRRTNDDEREGGKKRDGRSKETADEATFGVSDDGYRLHHGARRELPKCDGTEELCTAHPVVDADGVMLHERDDHKSASERERTDLERNPRKSTSAAERDWRDNGEGHSGERAWRL